MTIVHRWIEAYLRKLGFCHFKHHHIKGDARRLILEDAPSISLVNTLINLRSGTVKIGAKTIFGHGCMIITGVHDYSNISNDSLAIVPDSGRDIVIGRNCWIGSGAIILGGTRIGDNCVIGAGAVVRGQIDSRVFAAGVPARPLRKL